MSNLIVELSRVIYIKQSDKWGAIMGIGIIVCGLNGTGKSTLGKALVEKLNFHFIDNENLYFPKTDPYYLILLRTPTKKPKNSFWMRSKNIKILF